jgi:DNA-binding transcriptional ArsR family regulator
LNCEPLSAPEHVYKLTFVQTKVCDTLPRVSKVAPILDDAFHALSDPNRRAILTVVRPGRRAVGEIASELGLSQQIVSHHLKVLRQAGLVTGTRAGTRHLYAVRVEGLAAGLAFFDNFWPERLGMLKQAVEHAVGGEADG